VASVDNFWNERWKPYSTIGLVAYKVPRKACRNSLHKYLKRFRHKFQLIIALKEKKQFFDTLRNKKICYFFSFKDSDNDTLQWTKWKLPPFPPPPLLPPRPHTKTICTSHILGAFASLQDAYYNRYPSLSLSLSISISISPSVCTHATTR
jgi:hypothetical protein